MGLSKSMEDEEVLTLAGEVMGTPNYMSPEQIDGANDVDLRADIYSLGATLYHVLTGHMPFQGSSVMDVLRKQAKAELADPRSFKPALSEHCVSLLQIMLAKQREDRQADWATVVTDMDAVLHGRPPTTKLPAAGQSVLIRRGQGGPQAGKLPAATKTPAGLTPKPATGIPAQTDNKTGLWIGVGAVVVGLLVVAGVFVAKQQAEAERVRQREAAAAAARQQAQNEQAQREKQRADLWQVAADFAQANPDAFDQAIGNFTDIQRQCGNTKYEMLARNEIARLHAAKSNAMTKAYAALVSRARVLVEQKDYTAAANIVARYQGPFAADLKVARAILEKRYRTLAAEAQAQLSQAEREQAERRQQTLNAVAEAVLAGEPAKARQLCQPLLAETAPAGDRVLFQRLAASLEQVATADKLLLAAFAAEQDKLQDLTLDGAKMRLRIIGVRGENLQIERPKGVGWVGGEITLAQLALEEKQTRLTGKLEPTAMRLWAGLVLLKASQFDRALEQFKNTGELAAPLQEKMEGARKTLFARALATLPPEEQVRRVLGELKSLNAGFDGRGAHKVENGQVTELVLNADNLTDLAPLAGLKGLRRLSCSGSNAARRGQLASLAPLAGLPLTTLCVSNTLVADCAPLKGMPLTTLYCDGTPLNDLVPLAGLKLVALTCNGTSIRDLAPLEGMPLLMLGCAQTGVTDLTILKTLPVQYLTCDAPLAQQHASLLRGLRTLTTINDAPASNFWATVATTASTERGQPLSREGKLGRANFTVYSPEHVTKATFTIKERPPKDETGKELVFSNVLEKIFFHFHGPNEGGHRWVIWKDEFQFEKGQRYKFTCYMRAPKGLKEEEILYFALTPATSRKEQGVRLNLRGLPENVWVPVQVIFTPEETDVREIQVTLNATQQELDLCDVRLGPAKPGETSGLITP
jgi:hypothetical protein